MRMLKAITGAAVAACTCMTAAPGVRAQEPSPAMIMARTVCFDEVVTFEAAFADIGAAGDATVEVNSLLQRLVPATSDRAAALRSGADLIPASPNVMDRAHGLLVLCMANVGVAADGGTRDLDAFKRHWASERARLNLPAAPPDADPVVMSAGAITIRQSEFEHALSTLPADYQTYARGAGKRAFAEDYLRMRLLADAGMKAGLAADADVIKQVEMLRANTIANAHLKTIETNIDAGLRQKYGSAGLKQERDALLKAELAKLVADAKPTYSDAYFGAKKN